MSTDLKSMHMGQITSFFIPNVTLVGEGCSKEIPARLKSINGAKPLVVTDQILQRKTIVVADEVHTGMDRTIRLGKNIP